MNPSVSHPHLKQFLVILLPGSNTPRPQHCHKPLQPQYVKFKIRVLHTFLLAIFKALELFTKSLSSSSPGLWTHNFCSCNPRAELAPHTGVVLCQQRPHQTWSLRKCRTETFQQLAKGWLRPRRIDSDLELISAGETHTCLWAQWIHMVLTDSGRLSITLNHQEYECPSTPRYCTDPCCNSFH